MNLTHLTAVIPMLLKLVRWKQTIIQKLFKPRVLKRTIGSCSPIHEGFPMFSHRVTLVPEIKVDTKVWEFLAEHQFRIRLTICRLVTCEAQEGSLLHQYE